MTCYMTSSEARPHTLRKGKEVCREQLGPPTPSRGSRPRPAPTAFWVGELLPPQQPSCPGAQVLSLAHLSPAQPSSGKALTPPPRGLPDRLPVSPAPSSGFAGGATCSQSAHGDFPGEEPAGASAVLSISLRHTTPVLSAPTPTPQTRPLPQLWTHISQRPTPHFPRHDDPTGPWNSGNKTQSPTNSRKTLCGPAPSRTHLHEARALCSSHPSLRKVPQTQSCPCLRAFARAVPEYRLLQGVSVP